MALVVIYVVVCLSLIATVLLQSGKSAGLSGSIAGGAQTLFGKSKKGWMNFWDVSAPVSQLLL